MVKHDLLADEVMSMCLRHVFKSQQYCNITILHITEHILDILALFLCSGRT